MTKTKFIITFAGPVGSSKTPIASYLSLKLNLPVYNNDAIRTEVIEDLGQFDAAEHLKRRQKRIKTALAAGISFIVDASVDRHWSNYHQLLVERGYKWFIISLDLSKEFIRRLYHDKSYFESLQNIDQNWQEHQLFLKNNNQEISVHITDKTFPQRLNQSYKAVKLWIDK